MAHEPVGRHEQVRVPRGPVHVLQEAVGPRDRRERRRRREVGGARPGARRGRRRPRGSSPSSAAAWRRTRRCRPSTGSPRAAAPAMPPAPAPRARRAMPSARYSVSTPKGPGPAPVNFITQRRPSPVSTRAGEVLARGSTSSTRATVAAGGTGSDVVAALVRRPDLLVGEVEQHGQSTIRNSTAVSPAALRAIIFGSAAHIRKAATSSDICSTVAGGAVGVGDDGRR